MTEFLNSEPENDESDNDGSKNKIESQNIKTSKKKYNACGFNYLMENYPNRKLPYPVVKVCQYPMPRKMIEKLAKGKNFALFMNF